MHEALRRWGLGRFLPRRATKSREALRRSNLPKKKLPHRGTDSEVTAVCELSKLVGLHPYSPGAIAPEGQTSAQVPQSTHTLASIEYFSPSEIAPEGHSSMQVPHAMHSSPIT